MAVTQNEARAFLGSLIGNVELLRKKLPATYKTKRKKAHELELKLKNYADPSNSGLDDVYSELSGLIRGLVLNDEYNFVGPGTDLTDPKTLPKNVIDKYAEEHDLGYVYASGALSQEAFDRRIRYADNKFINQLESLAELSTEPSEKEDALKIVGLMKTKQWTDDVYKIFNVKKRLTDEQYGEVIGEAIKLVGSIKPEERTKYNIDYYPVGNYKAIRLEDVVNVRKYDEQTAEQEEARIYPLAPEPEQPEEQKAPEPVTPPPVAPVTVAPVAPVTPPSVTEEKKEPAGQLDVTPAISPDLLKALLVMSQKKAPVAMADKTVGNASFPNTPYTGERNLALLQNQATVDYMRPTAKQERQTMDWYRAFNLVQAPNSNVQLIRGAPITQATIDPGNSLLATNANSEYNIRYKGPLFQPAEVIPTIRPDINAIEDRRASMFTDSQKQMMFKDRAFPATTGMAGVGKPIQMYSGMNEMTPTANRYSQNTRLANPDRVIISTGKYTRV